MATDNNNNSGSLMWQDKNGNWHSLGEIQDIKTVCETNSTPILHATSLCDSEEVIIRSVVCGVSEEEKAAFWAAEEGLEIIKRGENNGN